MMRKIEHRPIKGAEELENEKRLRAAAEEKARGLEVVNSKLRREAAAKPAFQQRERDRSKMISEDYEEHLAAAQAEKVGMERVCKLSAVYSYLKVLRRQHMQGCIQQWSAAARHIVHTTSSAAAVSNAERKGYARALQVALQAERSRAEEGEGKLGEQKLEWSLQLEEMKNELKQSEALRREEGINAAKLLEASEARRLAAQEAEEEYARIATEAEAAATKAIQNEQAAVSALKTSKDTVGNTSRLVSDARSARIRLGAVRIAAAIEARWRVVCMRSLHDWKHASLSISGVELLQPLRRKLHGSTALAEKRAENARSALRAEEDRQRAEAEHEVELKNVARQQVLSARREYAERARRAAAEHASKKREKDLKAEQPSIAEAAAMAALHYAERNAGGSPQQLAALHAACCACERRRLWRLYASMREWAAITAGLGALSRFESWHENTVVELSQQRKELATALLDSEADRKKARSSARATSKSSSHANLGRRVLSLSPSMLAAWRIASRLRQRTACGPAWRLLLVGRASPLRSTRITQRRACALRVASAASRRRRQSSVRALHSSCGSPALLIDGLPRLRCLAVRRRDTVLALPARFCHVEG